MTNYHAKYLAHEITRRCASDSIEKLTAVLSDAQVDLNPHQIDAALFAFRNPLSRGAILADEVGLGKTIEAGLLVAQMWAERKRQLLVIAPANLRKQWSQELADKFFLPSAILENRTFNEAVKAGNLNPFQQNAVVICSYQFAKKCEPYIRQTEWDLVVIDEAHRLRNVYKPTNKIANAIKQAVAPYRKVLLTATPLQNSLLELYGLVSIIDDFAFGDLKAFRARFTRLGDNEDFRELKERLAPVCKRTLRKQVLEYVKYTDRHALVQEFVPSEEEQRLYDLVSAYLQQPTLYALPASQRALMTLILRKLLASSTYAISNTLQGLATKLETAAAASEKVTGQPKNVPVLRYYNVFNVEQTEGIEAPDAAKFTPLDFKPIEAAEAMVKGYADAPAIEHGGQQACYRPLVDIVRMPEASRFASAEEYYSTLFHELGHSTGHSKRLDRKLDTDPKPFGSPDYGREELIAEMSAAFLCGHVGIRPAVIENQAAYLHGWLKQLKDDKRLVISAAGAAQKAADWIRGERGQRE